ncbi:hypothetical protein [Novosphingobium sp.]|uniref:hypothetical protein n=1 Tax=Novosphingobium sp. TaxID=1874826 RepID=UPI0025FCA72C|nr:hypothetical protein [Novosphingobium sp.]
MRMIPIRPLLIAAASASLMLAGAPAFAQDTMQTAPQGADMPGNMAPPPADTMNKAYPVCRGGMVDNCQNPGEGGAPGRSRASDVKGGSPAHGMGMHHKMNTHHKMRHHKM